MSKAIQLATEYFYCIRKSSKAIVKKPLNVCWTKPDYKWHKLNTDGSSMGNPGPVMGDSLRIIMENWLVGFFRAVGIATSVDAEQ